MNKFVWTIVILSFGTSFVLIMVTLLFGTSIARTKIQNSETKIMVATYTGSSTQGYYFANELDSSSMLFDQIKPDVLKEYNLLDREYIPRLSRSPTAWKK